MITRKSLILFLLASLTGHALVLALAIRVDWTVSPRPERVMTVELKMPEQPVPQGKKLPAKTVPPKSIPAPEGIALREDSIALQSRGSRYDDYLLAIRKKIERIWNYPQKALAEQREGTAVIRFTIDGDGALTGYHVMTTSGSPILDEGALTVVRSAAPYEPLPERFKLSRLNVTASFTYRMSP